MSRCSRCQHEQRDHKAWKAECLRYADGLDDPFVPGAKWERCHCTAFEDAVLPPPGEPLVFGIHVQRVRDAETAPVWPPLGAVAARRNARTTRRLVKR